eukprot:5238459-Alexandrium_andersonii.AAC.1
MASEALGVGPADDDELLKRGHQAGAADAVVIDAPTAPQGTVVLADDLSGSEPWHDLAFLEP